MNPRRKAQPTQTVFDCLADEEFYLIEQIEYWLYFRSNSASAVPFAQRLRAILQNDRNALEGIPGRGAWALVNEVEGNWPCAVNHRVEEVGLIERLHSIAIAGPPALRRATLRGYPTHVLIDKMWLLSCAHWENGNPEEALSVLDSAEQKARESEIEFEDYGLRKEICEDMTDQE